MGLSSLTCHRRLGKCRRVEVVSRCLPPRATEFLYLRLTEFSGNGVFHFQSRLRDLNLNSPVRVIVSLISYRTDSATTTLVEKGTSYNNAIFKRIHILRS